jgi:hypothetical protein
MTKEICKCGKPAVWFYMPGSSLYCDDCVPRGCSCNEHHVDINAYHPPLDSPHLPEGEVGIDWKWIEINQVWCYIDNKGREFPCCEYMYDNDEE